MKSIFKKNIFYKYFEWKFKTINDKQVDLKKEFKKITSIINSNQVQKSIEELKRNEQDMQQQLSVIVDLLRSQLNQNNIILERTKQFESINTELLKLKESNKCKILLVGFYGASNTGDELMLQAILSKLDCEKNEVTVMLADNPNYNIIKKYNVNYLHYPKTNMDINMISKYFDKIIFGGGAIIDDVEYDDSLAYKYNVANILLELSIKAIYYNKEVYCIGLSSNSYISNFKYIKDLEFVIKNAKYFSLRDENSKKTLINAKIKETDRIEIIDDIAYSLPKLKYNIEKDSFNIGLVLIGSAEENKLITILNECNKFIYQNSNLKNGKILLIPFYNYNNSDTTEYKKIVNHSGLKSNVEILEYEQDYEKVMKQLSFCNILVGMRYHASLLALKSGIPSVHIIYDVHRHYKNKMNFLKEQYGYPETYLSFKDMKQNDIVNSLNFVLNNYEEINKKYIKISNEIEKRANKKTTEILN